MKYKDQIDLNAMEEMLLLFTMNPTPGEETRIVNEDNEDFYLNIDIFNSKIIQSNIINGMSKAKMDNPEFNRKLCLSISYSDSNNIVSSWEFECNFYFGLSYIDRITKFSCILNYTGTEQVWINEYPGRIFIKNTVSNKIDLVKKFTINNKYFNLFCLNLRPLFNNYIGSIFYNTIFNRDDTLEYVHNGFKNTKDQKNINRYQNDKLDKLFYQISKNMNFIYEGYNQNNIFTMDDLCESVNKIIYFETLTEKINKDPDVLNDMFQRIQSNRMIQRMDEI